MKFEETSSTFSSYVAINNDSSKKKKKELNVSKEVSGI